MKLSPPTALAAALLTLSGCTAYLGEQMAAPVSGKALLVYDQRTLSDVVAIGPNAAAMAAASKVKIMVLSIDGQKVPAGSVVVEPGKHTVELQCWADIARGRPGRDPSLGAPLALAENKAVEAVFQPDRRYRAVYNAATLSSYYDQVRGKEYLRCDYYIEERPTT